MANSILHGNSWFFSKRTESWSRPLWFIAQVNFTEVAAQCPELYKIPWGYPSKGIFQVFYDLVEQPWGFNADHAECWKVFWYPSPDALNHVCHSQLVSYPAKGVGMKFKEALTTPDHIGDFLEMSDQEEELYHESRYEEEIFHQVGGWSMDIQNPPFYGIPPDAGRATNDEESDVLGASWRLVLQIDSDEKKLGYMWGDAGMLYIGCRESELSFRRLEQPMACPSMWLST